MPPVITSPRLEEIFSLERLIVRDDLQQDKRATLLAIFQMFEECDVPYVITGGLAVQLYTPQPRNTVDVDIVSLRAAFKKMQATQPWEKYGFELVFDRRRYIKIRHVASNVEVDINLDTRFARLLENPRYELIEGRRVPFTSPEQIAFAKLRTQRHDWPRDPGKRSQDRTDLIKMFQGHPEIIDKLRVDPLVNDEMQQILDQLCRELRPFVEDDFPPEDE